MIFRQRIRLAGPIVALAILPLAGLASAQDWPARNVTVVVPLAAGSASDIMARVVMDQVGRQLGKTFVIENRPGAGGTIGANMVANSAPDGYTILAYGALGTAMFLIVLYLQEVLGYSPLESGAALLPMTVLMLGLSGRSGRTGGAELRSPAGDRSSGSRPSTGRAACTTSRTDRPRCPSARGAGPATGGGTDRPPDDREGTCRRIRIAGRRARRCR